MQQTLKKEQNYEWETEHYLLGLKLWLELVDLKASRTIRRLLRKKIFVFFKK